MRTVAIIAPAHSSIWFDMVCSWADAALRAESKAGKIQAATERADRQQH
jgi:hypothetical protein